MFHHVHKKVELLIVLQNQMNAGNASLLMLGWIAYMLDQYPQIWMFHKQREMVCISVEVCCAENDSSCWGHEQTLNFEDCVDLRRWADTPKLRTEWGEGDLAVICFLRIKQQYWNFEMVKLRW